VEKQSTNAAYQATRKRNVMGRLQKKAVDQTGLWCIDLVLENVVLFGASSFKGTYKKKGPKGSKKTTRMN
jgi:hypothetical protein